MVTNIFVLGLDDLNAETLRSLPQAEQYAFHCLLEPKRLRSDDIKLPELLADAERELYRFQDSVDAIVGYWDFPVSSLVPILCERFGTLGPSLEAVVKCEHKYWSRLVQQQVIDEYPDFGLVEPAEATSPPARLDYPLWVKPVKSAGSALAFHVNNADEFTRAMDAINHGIDQLAGPFQYVLDHIDAPPDIARSGRSCMVEEEVTGVQITVEGYVQRGRVMVYGMVRSINYPDLPSFQRYQYPAELPSGVADRLVHITERVIAHIGLDNSTLNVEYFWDPERDTVGLLEINPRHSQSHARLFQMVDGLPNHHVMVNVALGRDPALPHGQGPHRVAAKWFLRRFDDALVLRVPTPDDIVHATAGIPDVVVDVVAQEGHRLSDLPRQDSYSYELAHVYLGADSEDELIDRYEKCAAALPFEFGP